jgi:hypothetical protein
MQLCGSGAATGFLFILAVYYQRLVGLNPLQFCVRTFLHIRGEHIAIHEMPSA